MSSAAVVPVSPRRYATGLEAWASEPEGMLEQTVQCADRGLGHLEETLSERYLEIASASGDDHP